MQLSEMTWPQVEAYLKTTQTALVPIGSVEQHGPTGLIGTDHITADHIAQAVAEKMNLIVTAPVCFGMALHHMAFPGTISLQPLTYIQVIQDIINSLKTHGFNKIIFINGHGGNIASVQSAFSQIKNKDDETYLKLINWWSLPSVKNYEEDNFPGEAGYHATIGEVAVTMHTHPKAFEKIESTQFKAETITDFRVRSPKEFRQDFPDGRMGSNPGHATEPMGKLLFKMAVDEIIEMLK